MPKKRKAARRASGARRTVRGDGTHTNVRPVRFRGRYFGSVNSAQATYGVTLSPLVLDSRLLAVSDQFQLYRFESVRVSMWRASSGSTSVVAYTPTLPSAFPATIQEALDLPVAKIGVGLFGRPYPSITFGPAALMENAPRWFRRGTAYDDLLEVQGQIWFISTDTWATAPLFFEVTYEIEMCASMDAGDTIRIPRSFVTPQIAGLLDAEEAKCAKPQHIVPDVKIDRDVEDLRLAVGMIRVTEEEDTVVLAPACSPQSQPSASNVSTLYAARHPWGHGVVRG